MELDIRKRGEQREREREKIESQEGESIYRSLMMGRLCSPP
jgi:hypothetical protein